MATIMKPPALPTDAAILEPPETLRSLDATYTAADWEHFPLDDGNRYEIIAGVLYVSTSLSSFHAWVVGEVNDVLREQLLRTGVAFVYLSPVGVYLTPDDRVQPDILVVRREDMDTIHDKRIHGAPALVVEVLSPSNTRYDTGIKLAAYARAGVPEYWIVRPKERDVLIYSEPDVATGEYRAETHVAPDGELVSPTLPVRAAVAGFFTGSPDESL